MYQVHPVIGVIETETGEHIKPRSGNPRWDEYRQWLRAGNVPAPQPLDEEPLTTTILERKLTEVQQWVERGHNSPIEVNGYWFDADAVARENISGTLTRLMRGSGLMGNWIGWRTYHNEMLWAGDSANTVQIQLGLVSEAIEDRKQGLMIQAWQKKAQLHAFFDAGDRTELLTYQVDAA